MFTREGVGVGSSFSEGDHSFPFMSPREISVGVSWISARVGGGRGGAASRVARRSVSFKPGKWSARFGWNARHDEGRLGG